MSSHLIVVETLLEYQDSVAEAEPWYDVHAAQVAAIEGVVRVERYWEEGEPGKPTRHLAIYHVSEPPAVMTQRFAQAKAAGTLTGSPFPTRVMRTYRQQAVVEPRA